jgi:hypothetical protein
MTDPLLDIIHFRGGLLLPTPTGLLLRLFSSVFEVATPTIRRGISWSSHNRQLTPHRKKRSAGCENDLVPAPLNCELPVHVRFFTMVMALLGAEMEPSLGETGEAR